MARPTLDSPASLLSSTFAGIVILIFVLRLTSTFPALFSTDGHKITAAALVILLNLTATVLPVVTMIAVVH